MKTSLLCRASLRAVAPGFPLQFDRKNGLFKGTRLIPTNGHNACILPKP